MLIVHHIRVTSGFSREVDENCALWYITQRIVVIPCRRFGTTYRSHHQGSRILLSICRGQESCLILKMGPIACPEASVRDYRYTLRHITEERSSHLVVVRGRAV